MRAPPRIMPLHFLPVQEREQMVVRPRKMRGEDEGESTRRTFRW